MIKERFMLATIIESVSLTVMRCVSSVSSKWYGPLLGLAEDREVRSLILFAEKTKAKHKLMIVTYEEEGIIERSGYTIEVVLIHKFLLS